VGQTLKSKIVVLVVEDDFLIRMNAADTVRDFGFDVAEAADADEAIKALEDNPDIAVVFTDIQMPGSMDGLRLASVVRNRWPPVALLVTSGQVSPHVSDLPAGVHFLPKPYLPNQLKSHLDALAPAGRA
jgi:two-component system, response regulator PdtaR